MTSELKHLLIGVVIFLMLGITGMTLFSGVLTYNPALLGNQSGKYTQLNTQFSNLTKQLSKMENNSLSGLNNASTSSGTYGYLDSAYKSVSGTIKTTATSLTFLKVFFSDVGGYLGIPDDYKVIFNLGGIILLFIIVWSFISTITKSA